MTGAPTSCGADADTTLVTVATGSGGRSVAVPDGDAPATAGATVKPRATAATSAAAGRWKIRSPGSILAGRSRPSATSSATVEAVNNAQHTHTPVASTTWASCPSS